MKTKWTTLALCCLVMGGTFYVLDMPASVHRQLKEAMPREGFETKYHLQFTLTQAPGMVLPFFACAFADRFGGRLCLMALSAVVLLGQIIASLGANMESWSLLLVGRFTLGLATDSLCASNQAFLKQWFEGGQLGLALGISCAVSYVGLLLSQILSPIFSTERGVAFSYWAGAMAMTLSFFSSFVVFIIGWVYTRRIVGQNQRGRTQVASVRSSFETENMELDRDQVQREANSTDSVGNSSLWRPVLKMLRKMSCSFWLLCCLCLLAYSITVGFIAIASGFMLERNLFKSPPSDCVVQYPNLCSSGYLAPDLGNNATDSSGGPCPCGTEYAPAIPHSLNITRGHSSWQEPQYIFEDLTAADIDCADSFWKEACTRNYCKKQAAATKKAGLYMAVPFLVTVATSFLFGHFMVDKMGWRAEMLAVAQILFLIEHSLFAFTTDQLMIPLVLNGLAYSMVASSIWPSVPLTVKEDVTGRAYGLMTCIQGIGLTSFPITISAIYSNFSQQYRAVELFLIATSAISFLISMILVYTDKKNGGILSTVYESDYVHSRCRNYNIGDISSFWTESQDVVGDVEEKNSC